MIHRPYPPASAGAPDERRRQYGDLAEMTQKNTAFRRVVYTVPGQLQVVLMSVRERIDWEEHSQATQFFYIVQGIARITKSGQTVPELVQPGGFSVITPGTLHLVENASPGSGLLKLYTLYSPPQHKSDAVEFIRKSP